MRSVQASASFTLEPLEQIVGKGSIEVIGNHKLAFGQTEGAWSGVSGMAPAHVTQPFPQPSLYLFMFHRASGVNVLQPLRNLPASVDVVLDVLERCRTGNIRRISRTWFADFMTRILPS